MLILVVFEELAQLTQIERAEIENYFNLKELTTKIKNPSTQRKVTFHIQPKSITLPQYLSCFEYSSNNTMNQDAGFFIKSDYSKQKYFNLSKSITQQEKQMMGNFLFSKLMQSEFDEQKFIQNFLTNIPLTKMSLLDLLVQSWLNNNFSNISTFFKLFSILSGFAKLEIVKSISDQNETTDGFDDKTNTFESYFVNEYLFKLKSTLESSTSFTNSLLICQVVRSMLVQVSRHSKNFFDYKSSSYQMKMLQRLKVILIILRRSIC